MQLIENGNLIRATQKLEIVAAKEPSWIEPKTCLIDIYSDFNDWSKCAIICKAFTISHPNLITPYSMYAFALKKLKQYEKAIEICTEGLELFPTSTQLYSIRGECHYDAQNYKQATSDFHKTIELDRRAKNLVGGVEKGLKPWKNNEWRLR